MLDDMAEEGSMCESQDAHVEKRNVPEVTSCCPWAARLTGQMDRLSRDLMALQEQLHQLVAQRKAAWWEKVRLCVHGLWRFLGSCISQLSLSLSVARAGAASLGLLCATLAAVTVSELQLPVC